MEDRDQLRADVLSSLFENVRDALIVAEARTGRIVMWNAASEALFGYGSVDALGMSIMELIPAPMQDERRASDTGYEPFLNTAMAAEISSHRDSGEDIDLEVSFGSFFGPDDDLYIIAVPRDITAHKRLERQLQQSIDELIEANSRLKELAATDTLTGLSNRDRAREMLEKFALLARRNRQPLTLAFLDLDHFKQVNDQHGHLAGDDVLRRLGALLLASFRGEDVVARWGGEEFIAGMFGMSKKDAVRRLASVLSSFRDQPFEAPHGTIFQVTCSAGVAEYGTDANEVEALFLKADEALYRAKEAGRDRVVAAD